MTLLHPWLNRWQRRPALGAPSSRIEVCPPALWPSSVTVWGRMRRWLDARSAALPLRTRPVNRLALVRAEFQDAMHDIEGSEGELLLGRIERARSLRELWHLRSTLYGVISVALNQVEAEARLAGLNRHFPVRAPRSTLAPQES